MLRSTAGFFTAKHVLSLSKWREGRKESLFFFAKEEQSSRTHLHLRPVQVLCPAPLFFAGFAVRISCFLRKVTY